MALTQKNVSNFHSAYGTPSSDSAWDKVEWSFKAKTVKVVLLPASTALEISLDGSELFATLPAPIAGQNTMVYDFRDAGISRIWVRKSTANIQLMAYGVH